MACAAVDLGDVGQHRLGEVQRVVGAVGADHRAGRVADELVDAVVVALHAEHDVGILRDRLDRACTVAGEAVVAVVGALVEPVDVLAVGVERVAARAAAVVLRARGHRRGGDDVVAGAAVHLGDVLQRDVREVEGLVAAVADDLDVVLAGRVDLLDAGDGGDADVHVGVGDEDPVVVARAGARVLERIEAVIPADQIGVGTVAAVENVVAGAAADDIVAGGARDPVVARATVDGEVLHHHAGEVERVVGARRQDGVAVEGGVAAVELLDAHEVRQVVLHVQDIRRPAADDPVVAGAAVVVVDAVVVAVPAGDEIEGVVLVAAIQRVVAGAAPDLVLRLERAVDRVVAGATVDDEVLDHVVAEIERVVAARRQDDVAAGRRVAAVELLDVHEVRQVVLHVQDVGRPAADDLVVARAAVIVVDAVVVAGAAGLQQEGVVAVPADESIVF